MEADDEDPSGMSVEFPSVHQLSLDALFDLKPAFWTERSEASTSLSLEAELALWEILDMDADGEESSAQEFEIDDLANVILNSS